LDFDFNYEFGRLPLKLMKKCLVVVLLVSSFGLLISAEDKSTQPSARDRLIGTWRLVSAENVQPDGSSQPFPEYGPHPIGYLMYDSTGHMCVTLANPNPSHWADPSNPTDAERALTHTAAPMRCVRKKVRSSIAQNWQNGRTT